ncbi:hypothetical protein [Bifidobacterium saguinibicoloris]|uniref:hypothetical protein n=1 Tax=Bifidobacterium saguinibicoloris TaxID=2834433 RepID=UPI001C55FCE0|nr:hypothetical protein [Bifidobacterium saguinibicoloris]MBW3079886.1 hypothetical protein [Bifidobacterium saguinibicoloris]
MQAHAKAISAYVESKTATSGIPAPTNGTVDGWALSPQGRSILRQATDNNGRPLFLGFTGESDVSTVLGNRTYISKGVHVPARLDTGSSACAK